jgi:hypothetical protein
MVSNPEKNSNLQYLLDDICELIGVSTEFNRSLNWQLACGYLLLKSSFNRIIGYRLRKEFNYDYMNFKILLNNQIEQKANFYSNKGDLRIESALKTFMEHRIIRRKTLRVFMDDMKTNLELKILAFLFGGRFIPNEKSNDGTGCYTFKKKNKKTVMKLDELINDGLILGLFNHWIAVKNVFKGENGDFIIDINDPLHDRKNILLNDINENYRFYHYDFDEELQKKMDKIVRRALHLRKYPKIH